VQAVLWGREGFDGERLPDQALARAHQLVLAEVAALGYGGDVADELEGICSAAGLEDGHRDYDFIVEVLGSDPSGWEGAEAFWPWPFAA